MHRRRFLRGVAVGAFAAPLAALAKPSANPVFIGFLREGRAPIPEPLIQAMHRRGWIEHQNVRFVSRYADDVDQLPALASELVRSKVHLIIAGGTGPARAAKQATTAIPVVFSVGGDPVARGLVISLHRPGGNLTGFALGIYDEKQLQILKAALPDITRVAYPVLPGAIDYFKLATAFGMQVLHVAVQTGESFGAFFTSAEQMGADAALIPDVARLTPHLQGIGIRASQHHLPTMGFRRVFAESGGLLSYGPLLSEQYERMAVQIDKILNGANPSSMPVEQPTRFELVINLREAERLGVSIQKSVLLAADELIR
jgi:putative ABC transport system substrate-binding protein